MSNKDVFQDTDGKDHIFMPPTLKETENFTSNFDKNTEV